TGRPGVGCGAALWGTVRGARDAGPAGLSDAACRSALLRAIGRARRAGDLTVTAKAADWPGFRRRARERIAAWTRGECAPDREPPDGGPAVRDEWAIYGHYPATLRALDAEAGEGCAVWVWRAREKGRPRARRRLGGVTVLDLEDDPPAVRRALGVFEARARSVQVALAYDADPALGEVFEATAAPRRARLL